MEDNTMKRYFLGFSFLASLMFLVPPAAAVDIKVMTQNQYLGADLAPILAATDTNAFNAAIVAALQKVAANAPAERMKALAADIAKERPALIGLQEVYAFGCSGDGCSDPSIAAAFSDHLQATLDALNGTYVEKATVVNFKIADVPFFINGVLAFVSVVDRDVILARADVDATPVDYTAFQGLGICLKPSGDGCNYSFVLSASTPLGPISVERGFVAVDATIDDKAYRLVNTHLELQQPDPTNPLSQVFQAAQAAELVQVLQYTTPPGRSLVVLGDMNSSPEHPALSGPLPLPAPFNLGIVTPYQQFVGAGYTDAWTLRPGMLPGYTCCQLEDLSNQRSTFYERIDMIFSLDAPGSVKKARVVGATISDRTPPPGLGLWPSDHGSVMAELQF
ncbi:MAG TPA: endonuclease/exonuclease/phosphatase family protein [Sulfuricaulis sp.]|nr:endonuclease/exonuclease/phosphatase family protein [Sulfuricaulis sp.]